MSINSISLLTSIVYMLIASFQGLHLSSKLTFSKVNLLSVGFLAVLLHSVLLYQWIDTPYGQNLCLSHLFSLVCWLISLTTLISALFKPFENLTIFILPVTALSILLVLAFPGQNFLLTRHHPTVLIHILISIVAFGMLGMAALQATLLHIQHHLIRNKSANGIVRLLPPLETMETLLFQIIGLGFLFLSASLTSAFLLSDEQLVGPRTEKVFLSLLTWGLFAALLYNRYQSGLRGPKAVRWTLTGVSLLIVAYLGGKLIT